MPISPLIIMLLSKQANCDVTTPHGANILRNDIEARIGEKLSINTIKRLVGVIKSDGIPRQSTRDILAGYLGFNSWKELDLAISLPQSSAFYKQKPYIDAREEPSDSFLNILWEPKHGVKIKSLGDGKYLVAESLNSKLQKGDILFLTYLAKNYPMVVSEVIRGEENLGCYIAGIERGIISIRRSRK